MIIGLCGFIGSGKDTASRILTDNGYTALSFADSLKDAASCIFGWDRKLLEGDTLESRGFRETVDDYWSQKLNRTITPRIALQILGTEAGRDIFGQNIWTASLEKKLINLEDVVVTDVRFGNEIDVIQENGGKIVHVNRGEFPEYYHWIVKNKNSNFGIVEYVVETQFKVHKSEWEWIYYLPDDCIFVDNSGTIEDLREKIFKIM